jgi:NADPH:quinone reductase-like Zn-dependent oxidoreductase
MKAIIIGAYGDSDVLELKDVPIPIIGDNEVLIKVAAASVNPFDWKIRQGLSPVPHLPYIMGLEAAGTVEQKGVLVSSLHVGDAVMARNDYKLGGAYAEYFSVPVENVVKIPANLAFTTAAGISLVGSTAWASLFDFAQLRSGQTILIQGSSGGVGSFAVQLAKLVGAKVIAITSTRNIEMVLALGADQVINYENQKVENEVSGVDVVFDTVGGKPSAGLWQTLREDGIYVSTVESEDKMLPMARQNNVRARYSHHNINGRRMEEIAALVSEGKVKVVIDKEYLLEEVTQAQDLSQSGRASGKIILKVSQQQ